MARQGTKELKAFIKEHGKLDKDTKKLLRTRIRESAKKPLAKAKQNASWSTRIPRATSLSIQLTARRTGVTLRTRKAKAPHGRPYEHRGKKGTFRHPVFGQSLEPRSTWTWVNARARPFLWPAAEPWRKNIDKEIGKAVDEVKRLHKFK